MLSYHMVPFPFRCLSSLSNKAEPMVYMFAVGSLSFNDLFSSAVILFSDSQISLNITLI